MTQGRQGLIKRLAIRSPLFTPELNIGFNVQRFVRGIEMMIDRCTCWHGHRRFPLDQLSAQMIRRAISLIVCRTITLEKRIALFEMLIRVAAWQRFLLRMIRRGMRSRRIRSTEIVHHQIVAGRGRSTGLFDIFLLFGIDIAMIKIIKIRHDHRHW